MEDSEKNLHPHSKSWELLLPLDSLPKNRRTGSRRSRKSDGNDSDRRNESLTPSSGSRRHPRAQDRRDSDRRGIEVFLPIHSLPDTVYQFLRDPQNISQLIPNIKFGLNGNEEKLFDGGVVAVHLDLDGTPVNWQSEVSFVDDTRSIRFTRVAGDLEACDGEIRISQIPGATLISMRIYLDFGFAGLERFLGQEIKSKIVQSLEGVLHVIKRHIEKTNPGSDKFAFLLHSTDLGLYEGAFSHKQCEERKNPLLEKIFSWLPPFKASHVYGVQSITGKIVEGDLIYSPLTPRHILSGDPQRILKHMVDAGRMAEEIGAQIMGLGAYTALVGRRGVQIADALSIPITTGTAYTIYAAMEALCLAASSVGISLKKGCVAVIGASGTIGGICTEFLASEVAALRLVARNPVRLHALAEKLRSISPSVDIKVSTNVSEGIADADVVLICTSSPDVLLDVRQLKPGTVVCDLSQPHNVSKESAAARRDVLVLDGGVIRPPGNVRFNFFFGLPGPLAFACMAETMILTLEGRFENYSLGGNITAVKVQEIGELGRKHGFKIGSLKSFGRGITPDEIEYVRESRP